MITEEQRKYYLEHSGLRCPFCHSDNIESGPLECDQDPYSDIKCNACGKEWTDLYKLVDIEEV